ncbi:hypothetical protein PBI_MARTIN_14 [Microbacterium phage Martin]|uniref:Uncharacterized protein n=17 Tax=Ilzatvirus teagan TaxID=2845595 RepID=A0A2L0HMU0_9CAUD|nr:hypothetical protein H3N90_gp13 [Microbacterium phage Teagan]AUX83037.1 hypothetical protein PBI_LUDGATE_13 [Microbacterium phage Ludgate]AVR56035.1 hypothetical protein PBI_BANDIK_13 [Microbacterium phage Bandik]AVR56342.1 hypothetical protein PBI_NAGEM_13 [Microbacterium phage Nagem]AWN03468.1 hypothetical protein PBI_GARGOYLE_13 [Microbacterium phage Gargoyle]AWN03728.1 hypothetical protein PBI_MARTIN_14 [Microbacterium phage Martin]QBZ72237.1 hypothetical protein SEA_RIYHIL_13 [Microba
MSDIKPSSHGIVVEHKENGTHYAISDKNYNSKVHRKVRDLKAGESVRSYVPRKPEPISEVVAQATPATQGPKPGSDGK